MQQRFNKNLIVMFLNCNGISMLLALSLQWKKLITMQNLLMMKILLIGMIEKFIQLIESLQL